MSTAGSPRIHAPESPGITPVRHKTVFTFEEIIAPLTLDEFYRDVRAQQPAVFRNPGGRNLTSVFSVAVVDHLLSGSFLRGTDVMLVRDGAYPARPSYTTTNTWADAS